MKQSVLYFQQDALSYRKKYSISSQRKHLENKWEKKVIFSLVFDLHSSLNRLEGMCFVKTVY